MTFKAVQAFSIFQHKILSAHVSKMCDVAASGTLAETYEDHRKCRNFISLCITFSFVALLASK